jgi:hypothetical protein
MSVRSQRREREDGRERTRPLVLPCCPPPSICWTLYRCNSEPPEGIERGGGGGGGVAAEATSQLVVDVGGTKI